MGYTVKERFLTLQGEGRHAGRAAVFVRFSGCNLWSGREKDRAEAICRFCDTDFLGTDGEGGGKFADADALADAIVATWRAGVVDDVQRYVVFTGGEPTLQLDDALVEACHARAITVAIETNGTREVPAGVDWICVSPKAGATLVQRHGHELKLVYPQPGLLPEALPALDFAHWLLQPMDGPKRDVHTAAAVAYCRSHPRWQLSLQTHKLLGIP